MILKSFDNKDGMTLFVDDSGSVIVSLDDATWGPLGEIEIDIVGPPDAAKVNPSGPKHWAHMDDDELGDYADAIVVDLMKLHQP